ncbi:MAG: hypothetical protein GF329_12920 [Candidatus Lokiarchaeota archaeon]|nr:hypothetical protein [Candidatus Lokiarchaeota archaeon]
MSVIVPSYTYLYIRLISINQLIMKEDNIESLRKIKDINHFLEYIRLFYPGLNLKNRTIVEIQRDLNCIYTKIIGKILSISPINLQNFLKDYLLKYEIKNIKTLIINSIIGEPLETKKQKLNLIAEELIGNLDFIKELVKKSSLEEIQFYLRGTIYYQTVREGIFHFKNTDEIFILVAFLDRLYFEILLRAKIGLDKKEKTIIGLYIDYLIESYNLIAIYRGIKSKLEKNLLKQLLIENHLFLNSNKIDELIQLNDISKFIENLNEYFITLELFKVSRKKVSITEKEFKRSIDDIYHTYFLNKFQNLIDDIKSITLFQVIEFLIKKKNEINHEIYPSLLNIIHKKFENLKIEI